MNRLLLAAALLAACGTTTPEDTGPVCRAGTPGDVNVLASGLVSAEGIAFSPTGRLFVNAGTGVVELDKDGGQRVVATVPHAVGLTWWGDALYVAAGDDGSDSHAGFCNAANRGAVWRVTPEGSATVVARGILAPNFLTVTPWGTLLVSDDCTTNRTIWEMTKEGVVTEWSTGVPSANGLALDLSSSSLLVASTFSEPPALWRIPISGHSAGSPTSIATYPGGSAADGVVLDSEGTLYVALNTKGEIHRYLANGTSEPFTNGLDSPASMAFGIGEFDRCSIYVTSLFGGTVSEVFVGKPGATMLR